MTTLILNHRVSSVSFQCELKTITVTGKTVTFSNITFHKVFHKKFMCTALHFSYSLKVLCNTHIIQCKLKQRA